MNRITGMIVLLLFGAAAWAQDSLGVRKLGELAYWDAAADIVSANGIVCVATGARGLHVLRTTDLAELSVCREATGGRVRISADSKAYVYDNAFGVHVVDLANPAQPDYRGRINLVIDSVHMIYPVDMAVDGTTLYFADVMDSVFAFNVADPTHPHVAGRWGNEPGSDLFVSLAVSNQRLYVSSRAGFSVLDVSDPARMDIVGFLELSGDTGYQMVVRGSWVYQAAGEDGLRVINVANPANPILEITLPLEGGCGQIVLTGTLAVLNNSYALVTVDIQDPADPIRAGSCPIAPVWTPLAASESRVFLAANYLGVYAVDVSNAIHPAVVDSAGDVAMIYGIATRDGYVYAACMRRGLRVINAQDPARPVPVRHVSGSGLLEDLAIRGNYLYTIGQDAEQGNPVLMVYSLAVPDSPAVLEEARRDLTGSPRCITIDGENAYIGTDAGVQIISLSDPASPTVLGSYSESGRPQWVRDVAVRGTDIYFSTYIGELKILSAADPTNPVLINTYSSDNGASAVAVAGARAYLGIDAQRIEVLDVSQPSEVVRIAVVPTATAFALKLSGNQLFSAAADAGLRIYAISNPDSLTEVGYYADSSFAVSSFAVDNRRVVAVDYSKIVFYENSTLAVNPPPHPQGIPADIELSEAYPNPFNPQTTLRFSLPQAGRISIRIYDISGRLVDTLVDDALTAGQHSVVWNGRGRASGLYFARFTADNYTQSRKLVLLK